MEISFAGRRSSDCRFIAQIMYAAMAPGVGRGIFDEALALTGVAPVEFHEALLITKSSNWGQWDSFFILEADDGMQAAQWARSFPACPTAPADG